MGEIPEGKIFSRGDRNGDYTPENCRWMTKKEHNSLNPNNIFLTLDGKTKSTKEWASYSGTKYTTIYNRLKVGWEPKEAVYGRKDVKNKNEAMEEIF